MAGNDGEILEGGPRQDGRGRWEIPDSLLPQLWHGYFQIVQLVVTIDERLDWIILVARPCR